MKKIKVTANNIKEAAYGAYMDYIKYTEKWKKEASMGNFFVGYVGEAAYHQFIGKKYIYKHYENTGDGGLDVKNVQIKTTTINKNRELCVTEGDRCFNNTAVSKLVLVYFDKTKAGKEVYIVGEISKKNFLDKSKRVTFNYNGKKAVKYILSETALDKHFK